MTILHTDSVDLAYDDTGTGSPPLLLIHGFSCDRSDFAAVVDRFSDRHRVVAFDQRGHGDSSLAADGSYGFRADVEDARALCAALGVEQPVVVGHSLGGVTALHLAAEPDFARALVLLDSTIEVPQDLHGEMAAFVEGLGAASEEDYRNQVGEYARFRMIDPSDDTAAAAAFIDRTMRVPQEVYVRGAASILDADVLETALAVEVPTLFIASSLPWLDPSRVHELRPTWSLGRTVGAGHFHHLLVPEQVNAMLERFLACVDLGFTTAAVSEW